MFDSREQKRQAIRDEAMRLGIKVERRGQAFVLSGRGINMMVTDLAALDPRDLVPSETERQP